MKKVLIVITTSFVPYGGLTTVMMNYYRAINKNGLRIDFASTNEPETSLLDELKKNNSRYFCLGERKRNLLGYINKLRKLMAREKYDVIHVNGNSATTTIELLVAKVAGVSNRIVHNHNSTCTYKCASAILSPVFNRLYTSAIACSELAGDWIFGRDNYIVLNNAIDVERYSYDNTARSEIRKKYDIHDTDVVVGHVGKLVEQKNHEYLINVFSCFHQKIPHTKLLLVGDGVLRDKIESEVKSKSLDDCVIFAGMQDDASFFYSAMDVFVFPSKWEGLPLSLVEAQASGLRCVVSDKITKNVDVTGQVTFLSYNEDEEQWCNHIISMLDIDRTEASRKSISMIKKNGYDIETNVACLEKIYKSDSTGDERW